MIDFAYDEDHVLSERRATAIDERIKKRIEDGAELGENELRIVDLLNTTTKMWWNLESLQHDHNHAMEILRRILGDLEALPPHAEFVSQRILLEILETEVRDIVAVADNRLASGRILAAYASLSGIAFPDEVRQAILHFETASPMGAKETK